MAIQEVIRQLEQLNELHTELLELGRHKKRVLIDNQVDELAKIMSKESRLLKQVSETERQWIKSMADFLLEKGYKSNLSLTTTEIARLIFNAEDKKALLQSQQQLLETIERLKEVNALNQQLIENSLAFIDYSIDLLTDNTAGDMLYQNPVKPRAGNMKRNVFFETRA
ncbi:flagellar protein FlgN [Ferviditalea candida]|uniref:Flagellar protein FlgN n=1 Tax=Ferviditalea candida TaxID=3108399 RepID=A0ABU5ZIN0_9BACL|nr:flagellar protein FlgN [Paenibacillaceae bacterium T2]